MPKRRLTRLGPSVPSCSRSSRGFSLLELLVVLVITSLLTALLFPGLRAARESAHRLMCASNMRQLGTGLILYSRDYKNRVPYSQQAERNYRLDQMALTCRNTENPNDPNEVVLDGLGLLVAGGTWGYYCDSLECLYCPSHRGVHTYDRYRDSLREKRHRLLTQSPAFGNYQYVGYRPEGTRLSDLNDGLLLLTDGFRTQDDFNHERGMNQLFGDGSIEWWADVDESFFLSLPLTALSDPNEQSSRFTNLWSILDFGDREIGYSE